MEPSELPRLFILEDDYSLIEQLMGSTQEYLIEPLDLRQANTPTYLRGLDIKPTDTIILDLNLGLQRIRYSGLDVLNQIKDLKETGELAGLEKILVCTSLISEIDPQQPNINIALPPAEELGIEIYGLEKNMKDGKLKTYVTTILSTIQEIYNGERLPLNCNWTERLDERKKRLPRLFLIEDENRWIVEAKNRMSGEREVVPLALGKLGSARDWLKLGIKVDDIVVADYDLSKKLPSDIDGNSTIQFLAREYMRGNLRGMRHVAIYTSRRDIVQTTPLELLDITQFHVYLREKGINSDGKTISYSQGLAQYVKEIEGGLTRPINCAGFPLGIP